MQVKQRILGRHLVILVLVIGLLLSRQTGPVVSTPAPPDAVVAESPLRLAGTSFDPLSTTASDNVANELQISSYPGDGTGYYIVQFKGPIGASDLGALETIGAEIFDYIPDFAFIVKLNSTSLAAAGQMPSVRWVGLHQPAYRLTPELRARTTLAIDASHDLQTRADGKISTPELLNDGPLTLVISVFRGEALGPIKARIEGLEGTILDESQTEWKSKLKVSLPTAALTDVAAISGVRWIEQAPQWELANDVADNVMAVREVWDTEGLYGTGQVVAVCDTGLDQGSTVPASLHNDFENGSGVSRVVRIYDRVGDGANDVNSGHGTHVAGSVLGNGDLSGATPVSHTYPESARVGMAPEAGLIFQAVENNTNGALTGIPLDLNTLFAQADNGGAHLQTNSWGSDVASMYTTDSEDVDEYIWDHKDYVIFFSASNAGIDNNADGVVDLYSMGSPSTAKNCITVGASENNRPAISMTWGNGWPADFPANPVRDDRAADDTSGLAAFSSRGPALDGRTKPDIVAPGTWIASTKSTVASGNGWGAIDSNYMYMGGTSMSTPLAAGAAALVRQFYTDRESITPSAALIKATLANGATDIYPGQYGTGTTQEISVTRPSNVAGWGRVDVQNSIFPTAPRSMIYIDQTTGLNTGNTDTYTYVVQNAAQPLRTTLAWSDYPGSPVAAGGLVNDLDLTITGPGGATYYPNNANQRGANQQLAYDDGSGENYWTWNSGTQAAVRFTPTTYPAHLQTGLFYLGAFSYPKTFTWYIYAGNTSGPSSVLASGSSTIRANTAWHAIDFSSANVAIPSGDFFLAIELPDTDLAWFYDTSAPSNRSWDYDGSTWSLITTEDYLIHAVVSQAAATTQQDRVNNLVGIDIPSPTTGTYTLTVTGYNVPQGPQPYGLVVSGIGGMTASPPTLAGIPDQTLSVGESRDSAVDLWSYASDTQDADSSLVFSITNSPPAGAGISLDTNRYIDINPVVGWTGTANVVIQVQDTEGMTDTDTFRVIVLNHVPDIATAPATFDVTLAVDEVVTRTLTISNTGTTTLTFSLSDGGTSWLSFAPIGGNVPAGNSRLIDVIFDATSQSTGDYSTNVTVNSNDPDEGTVTLPATLHVSSTPVTAWYVYLPLALKNLYTGPINLPNGDFEAGPTVWGQYSTYD